jgi:type I restriction enzyme S subunit
MTWRPTRLKYLVSVQAGTWGDEPAGASHDVYCIRAADFDRQRLRVSAAKLPLRAVDPLVFANLSLAAGDIVLEKSGGGSDQAVGGSVLFDLDVDAVCSNFAARLRPLPGVEPRFLNYLMAAMYYSGVTDSLAKQTTGIANLDVGAYMATACSLPAAEGQKAVADYLDTETARIDALVVAKRRSVELLSERRAAAVGNAVFGGVRGDAVQSDPLVSAAFPAARSPLFWQRMPLKRIARMRAGEAITSEAITDAGDYPVFGGNGLRGFTTRFTHDGEYVLIGRQGALCGNINYASGRFWASEHAVVVATDPHTDVRWLGELLRTLDLNRLSQSAAQPGLSVEVLGGVEVAVPPCDDQQAIGEYLDAVKSRAASLTETTVAQINLLLERRRALITAAVTGQLDIPGVAA